MLGRAELRIGLAAIALALVAGTAVFEAPESASYAASGDVMFYLATADVIAHGGGIRTPFGPWEGGPADSLSVPAHYPPGFALVMSVPIRYGATAEQSARLVRALCFALSVALATIVVAGAAGLWAGVLAGVFVIISPFVVFTHTIPFSEPLFIPFVIATIGLMVEAPDRPLAYGLTAALGLGVRLIGVALTGAAMVWAFATPGSLWQRVRRAALAFVPSILVELPWLAYVHANHAGDDRHFGYYGPLGMLIRKLIGMNLWWFWSLGTGGTLVALAKLVILALFVVIVVGALRTAERGSRLTRLLAAIGLVVVCYDGVYLVARLVLDWANDFEIRNFSVVQILFAMAVAAALGRWWPRQTPAVRTVVAVLVAAWAVASATASARFLRDAGDESRQWTASVANSPLLGWVRANGQGREIYTNWNAFVWRGTLHRSRSVPLLYDADTIAQLGRMMARTNGVLIGWPKRLPLFSLRPDQMAAYASPDRIAAELKLPVLARFDEGTVWGPPTAPAQ